MRWRPSAVPARVAGLAGLLALGATTPTGPAAAAVEEAVPGVLVVDGRGNGHGRGMGQYGALGYAVDSGWTWQRITDHYYGGTTRGRLAGGGTMTVRMLAQDGADTVVVQERGQVRTSAPAAGPQGPAVRVARVAPSRWAVFDGPGCAGPWTRRPLDATTPSVSVSPTGPGADRQDALQLCDAEGVRWLRGDVLAVDDAGVQRTVNRLPTESYLRGVVPREMPVPWADLGGGRGLEALMAQAVAARSYGEAEARWPYAKTCDAFTCQVYGGIARQVGTVFTLLEDPRADRAVAATAGVVRLTPAGRAARTEFSSSTGGWTAGGAFPAVVDAGDAVALNPHRAWRVEVPFAAVEAAWPGVGALRSAQVRTRNGLGPDGGRALTVRLGFAGGPLVVAGEEFRTRLGLRSSWVVLSGAEAPGPQGWTLDLHGALHPVGGAPDLLGGPWWPGADVARGLAVGPTGAGLVLDLRGGLHPVAPAGVARPSPSSPGPYWPWPVARDLALLPGRADAGYVLDAFGGVHPFGGAPAAVTSGYWPGWDIARSLALLPDGRGGYVLDGFGGLHPLAVGTAGLPARPAVPSYSPGLDRHRDVVTRVGGGGWVVDAGGGVIPFGGVPAVEVSRPFPGTVVGASTDPAAAGPVVVADRTGLLSTAPPDEVAVPRDTWAGSVVRDVAVRAR